MPERSRRVELTRRVLSWSAAWVFAWALYLLLIDTTSLPELIVGVAAAAIAATGLELAREQQIVAERIRLGWLRPALLPIVRAPSDIALMCFAAMRQLGGRDSEYGAFRATRFRRDEEQELASGRAALAQSFGSFAPNTIVVGVDADRELILVHQLHRRGGRGTVDVLGLG